MDHLRDSTGSIDSLKQPQRSDSAECPVLLFQIGVSAFGLNVVSVVQVIPMLKLSPLPQKHPLVEGFANIRGQLIPVIAARQILGLPVLEPQLNTPIVLALINGQTVGLIVDGVRDVVTIPPEQIARPDSLISNSMEGVAVLLGVAYIEGQPVLLIDPDHLLNPAQIESLKRAMEALEEQMDGHGKPRRRRKNLSAALADQVATIALDLPPVDGESAPSPETAQPDREP